MWIVAAIFSAVLRSILKEKLPKKSIVVLVLMCIGTLAMAVMA